MSGNDHLDLSVCIVNWNTPKMLLGCLKSLEENGAGLRKEIIVVDNASTDDSLAVIAAAFPKVRLLANKENRGFTAAINQAFSQAKGDYILVLHPDTVCLPGTLQLLVTLLRFHPKVGIVGAKNVYPDGEHMVSCYSFHGLLTQFSHCFWLNSLFRNSRIFGKYELTYWDHNTTRAVDWVSYSSLLFRRELLDDVGLWDEGFFVWVADEDFCYRAAQRGWQTYFIPEAKIVHYERRGHREVETEMQDTLAYKMKWHLVTAQMVGALRRFQRKHRGLFYSRLFEFFLFLEYANRAAVWYALRHLSPRRRREASERFVYYTEALKVIRP